MTIHTDIAEVYLTAMNLLRDENRRLEQSAINYVEDYYKLACEVQTMAMKLERALREIHELKVANEYNTKSRKKFEAGYYQGIGE